MLESIKDVVDSIIVCDGAYQLYYETMLKANPEAKPWSTDGSLEILKLIDDLPPLRIIHPPDGKPWINQLRKREAMLDTVPLEDWFVGIDADELLMGNPEQAIKTFMESGCAVGQTPLYHAGLDIERYNPFWHPRFFLKTEGIHYSGTHWQMRDKYDRIIENVYPIQWSDACVIAHLKGFKPRSRTLIHDEYLDKLKPQGWIEPFQMAKE
jgi:hypothetical protein